MPMGDSVSVKKTFLPYLRLGPAAQVARPAESRSGRVEVDVEASLSIESAAGAYRAEAIVPEGRFFLRGPGDVCALAMGRRRPLAVQREEPPASVGSFEPNFMVALEFSAPDFPWRYTPAPPQAGRLMPWLRLVVLHQDEFEHAPPPARASLPTVTLTQVGADRLPSLTESWAWAHVEITSDEPLDMAPDRLEQFLDAHPERAVSRLLDPRHLAPEARYTAFLVPTFRAGMLAALGRDPSAAASAIELAWEAGTPPERIPYYHAWTFQTGTRGDFEYLVGLLRPQQLGPEVGALTVDVSSPGPGIEPPAEGEATVRLPGALGSLGFEDEPLPPDDPFVRSTRALLELALQGSDGDDEDPLYLPPVYGRWHAVVGEALPRSGWVDELNTNPHYRAIAGAGARFVRRNQEELVAEAWRQAGALQEANRARAAAAAALPLAERLLEKNLLRLEHADFLATTAPLHHKVAGAAGALVAEDLARVPSSLLTGVGLRKTLRSRGALVRRIRRRLESVAPERRGGRAAEGRAGRPAGAGTVHPRGRPASRTAGADGAWSRPLGTLVAAAMQRPHLFGRDVLHRVPGATRLAFEQKAVAHLADPAAEEPGAHRILRLTWKRARTASTPGLGFRAEAAPAVPNLRNLVRQVAEGIAPSRTIWESVRDRLAGLDGNRVREAGERVLVYPSFPLPLYAELEEMDRRLLLPCLGRIPRDAVGLLHGSARFVECFLAGANHEFARELMWRGYPTDARGSYFRHFWDRSFAGEASAPDVEELHLWRGGLGEHQLSAVPDPVVLVVRGQLLQKYPDTVVYVIAGRGTRSEEVVQPLFGGRIEPDIVFLGFPLSIADLENPSKSHEVVFEEQLTASRFALEVEGEGLTWQTLGVASGAHLSTTVGTDVRPGWSARSDTVARTLLQLPVRVFVPDRLLLGRP